MCSKSKQKVYQKKKMSETNKSKSSVSKSISRSKSRSVSGSFSKSPKSRVELKIKNKTDIKNGHAIRCLNKGEEELKKVSHQGKKERESCSYSITSTRPSGKRSI